MLVRQCLKTRADVLELIDFAQDRLKRHGYTGTPLSLKNPKVWENFRWTGLRPEDLNEEKVVTTPSLIMAVVVDPN